MYTFSWASSITNVIIMCMHFIAMTNLNMKYATVVQNGTNEIISLLNIET